jgi:two-component sensor histidine kinase
MKRAASAARGVAGSVPAGRQGVRTARKHGTSVALALASAIVGVLFVGHAWRDRVQAFQAAETLAGTLADVLAEHAGRLLETADVIVKQAVRLAGPAGAPLPSDAATQERLVELAATAPYVAAIWLGDAAGNAVLTTREHPAPKLNASDRAYFQVPRDHPDAFHIGLLPDNRHADAVLISTSRRVEPVDGPFRGFVEASLSPEHIRSLYRQVEIGYPTVFWLLDRELRPLLREPAVPVAELLRAPTRERFAPALRATSGLLRAQGAADGVERLYAFQRVPRYDLHVLVGIPVAEVERRWRGHVLAQLWAPLAGLAGLLALGIGVRQQARREAMFAHALEARVQERTMELEAAKAGLEEAVERREVLLREVNHRVKNSLQLVSGLLGLQQRGEQDPQVLARLAEARSRVATIAKLHDRLHHLDRVEAVAMGGYLGELCRDLTDSLPGEGSCEVQVEADDAELPTDLAVPLALIANELVTNAIKYAYPPGEAGTVRLLFRATRERLELAVIDRGAGLPLGFDPAQSGGLGMRIVTALVRQIGGAWRVERLEPGTCFAVEVPRPAV